MMDDAAWEKALQTIRDLVQENADLRTRLTLYEAPQQDTEWRDDGERGSHWHPRFVLSPLGPHAHDDATWGHLHAGYGSAIYRQPGASEPELTLDPDDHPLF